MSGIAPGDMVRMKSAVAQFTSPKARGSATFKAAPGRHLMFLFMGTIDPTKPEEFDARAVLRSMGWIPGPELQAQFDAEARSEAPEPKEAKQARLACVYCHTTAQAGSARCAECGKGVFKPWAEILATLPTP